MLEARERIGGRMWTRHEPELTMPVELGAEFIHGTAPLTHALLAPRGRRVTRGRRLALERAGGRLRAPRTALFPQVIAAMRRTRIS